MTVGERIKARRLELGMSLAQLGDKLGKNKTSIMRYESGAIEKLPIDILHPIAKALNTTPAYLMGWSEEPEAPAPVVDYVLAGEENPILIEVYEKASKMDKDNMERLLSYADYLLSSQNKRL